MCEQHGLSKILTAILQAFYRGNASFPLLGKFPDCVVKNYAPVWKDITAQNLEVYDGSCFMESVMESVVG